MKDETGETPREMPGETSAETATRSPVPPGRRSAAATLLTIAIQVFCRLGGAAAAVLLNLVMARTMAPAEVGIALSAMSAGVLGALLASGGIEAAAVRFLPRYRTHGETARIRGYLRFGTGQAIALGLGLGGIALAVASVAAARDPTFWPLAFAAPGAALLGLGRVLASQSLGFGRPLAATVPLQFVRPVILLAGVFALSLAVPAPSAIAVMACFILATMIAAGLQAALTLPLYRSVPPGAPDYSDWRQWIGIGLQLGAGAIFLEFGRDLAILVSSLSLSPAEVAVYAVAIRIIGFVKFGLVAVNQNFMPALSAAVARSDDAAMARIVAISNHLKFWPILASGILLVYAGPPLLALFGPEYERAAPLLLILMGEPLLMAMLGPASSLLAFTRHYRVIVSVTLAAAVVLVAGVLLGGRLAGPVGASWAVVIAWAFWSVTLAVLARRLLGIDITIIGSVRWSLARLRRPRR